MDPRVEGAGGAIVQDDSYVDADAALVAVDAAPSERVALSRERIVSAAVDFIDERGLPGLTMRRLGEALGVEAMSLYRYVPGKEDLLDAVVARIVDQMQNADLVDSPDHGWQEFMQRVAHGVRRVALDHPKVFPLVASRPPEAPWLRPPLRSVAWVETFLHSLKQKGFSDVAVVATYRAFTSFLLGHLLLEVANHGADVGPLDVLASEPDPSESELDPYPEVKRLRAWLSEDHAAVEFEESLETLLNRIALIDSDHPEP
jgi:AcrR family transcriptional regulator